MVAKNNKKLCGTLCETDGKLAYIGIGLNLVRSENDPSEFSDFAYIFDYFEPKKNLTNNLTE